jgi:hypothetical protein
MFIRIGDKSYLNFDKIKKISFIKKDNKFLIWQKNNKKIFLQTLPEIL